MAGEDIVRERPLSVTTIYGMFGDSPRAIKILLPEDFKSCVFKRYSKAFPKTAMIEFVWSFD